MENIVTKNYTIGIDIGGTKIGGVLYDGEKVLADYSLATPTDNLKHFLIMLKAVAAPLQEKAAEMKVKADRIGIGIAGVMDSARRKMLSSPNIQILNNVNLYDKISQFLGAPISIDNDANCFVRAEALRGAGRKSKNIYGIVIGTGIGGGWWHNGAVYGGAHGGAGEPGASIVDIQSGLNLERCYQKLMQNNPGKMSQEAVMGDPLAAQAYSEFARQLGAALSNIANILDPEIFILGGGTTASSDLFLSLATKEMKEHIESAEAVRKIKVAKSKLGANAGAIGAALLASME